MMDTPTQPALKRNALPWSLILLMVLTLMASRAIASLVVPVYDDAFITFRYAKNLATGHGFVYNTDERVLGTTSPAFGLIAAFFYLLHLPFPSCIIFINILFDALTLLIIVRALAGPEQRVAGLLFGTLFSLSPILARICVGGMEMSLFLLSTVSVVYLYSRGRKKRAIAIAAASFFIRPEAIILAGILGGSEWLGGRKRNALLMGLIAIAVLLPPILWIHFYYGQIIPQSLLAKSRALRNPVLVVLRHLLFNDPLSLCLMPVVVWGLARGLYKDVFTRTLALWSAAYAGAYLVARPHVWSWYSAPIHLTLLLLASVALAELGWDIPALRLSFLRKPISSLGVGVAVAAWMLVLARSGQSPITTHVYGDIQRWGREHGGGNATILASDIGAIGYYSNARIYDSEGLVWPSALGFHSLSDLIRAYAPDFVVLNATRSTQALTQTGVLGNAYRVVATFPKTADPPAILRKSLPADWVASYIVFENRRLSVDRTP